MDADLKQYLDEAFTGMARHLLHEIGALRSQMDGRFDSVDSRLKLQAGLIQSGARAIARLSEHAESSESRYVDLLTKYSDLESRVIRLESPRPEPGAPH